MSPPYGRIEGSKPSYVLAVTMPDGSIIELRIWGRLTQSGIDLMRRYIELAEETLDGSTSAAVAPGERGQPG